jgi:hypothetical protein
MVMNRAAVESRDVQQLLLHNELGPLAHSHTAAAGATIQHNTHRIMVVTFVGHVQMQQDC